MLIYIFCCFIGITIGVLCSIFVMGFRCPKHVGTILMNDSDGLYVELDNENSINTLHTSRYVMFSVKNFNKQK